MDTPIRHQVRNLARRGACVIALLLVANPVGVAHAGLDSTRTATDRAGSTVTIQMWDTYLNGVSPVDRNRLTREWFHSGRASFQVSGTDSESFAGTLELGYQIGAPWSMGVGINFSYETPNAWLDDASLEDPLDSIGTGNLFPGVSFSADIGNGSGIQEVATFSVPVSSASATVAVGNAHGTITGVAGGVALRPYARLIWPDHSTVTTYGELWNMN